MRKQVLEAVRRGESISGACRRLGVPRQTVYGWRARDAAFREELSEALSTRRRPGLVAVDGGVRGPAPLPERHELLALLAEQARNGSVRATEILLRTLTASDLRVESGGSPVPARFLEAIER